MGWRRTLVLVVGATLLAGCSGGAARGTSPASGAGAAQPATGPGAGSSVAGMGAEGSSSGSSDADKGGSRGASGGSHAPDAQAAARPTWSDTPVLPVDQESVRVIFPEGADPASLREHLVLPVGSLLERLDPGGAIFMVPLVSRELWIVRLTPGLKLASGQTLQKEWRATVQAPQLGTAVPLAATADGSLTGTATFNRVKFLPDGRLLLFGLTDTQAIQVWQWHPGDQQLSPLLVGEFLEVEPTPRPDVLLALAWGRGGMGGPSQAMLVGPDRVEAPEGEPLGVTPDHRLLLMLQGRDTVAIHDLSGQGAVRTVKLPASIMAWIVTASEVRMSPDSRWAAVMIQTAGPEGDHWRVTEYILIDLQTLAIRRLQVPDQYIASGDFSPDGRRFWYLAAKQPLVFGKRPSHAAPTLYLYDLQTGQTVTQSFGENWVLEDPVFSPDGTRLAAVVGPVKDQISQPLSTGLALLNPLGQTPVARLLATLPFSPSRFFPAWSLDSQRLRAGGREYDRAGKDLGESPHQQTERLLRNRSGTLFVQEQVDDQVRLVRVAADGSRQTLADGSGDISPDGRWLAALQWRPGERLAHVLIRPVP